MSDLLQVVAERIEEQAKRDVEESLRRLDSRLAEVLNIAVNGVNDAEAWRAYDVHIKAICSLAEPILLERNRKRMEQIVVSNMLAPPKDPFVGHL